MEGHRGDGEAGALAQHEDRGDRESQDRAADHPRGRGEVTLAPASPRSSSRLVSLASSLTSWEAHLARTVLEQGGIRAVLADENLVLTNWFFLGAVGGVKLQVREEDVPAALELLRRPPGALAALAEDAAAPEATPEGGVAMPRCPTCGAQAAAFEESAPMGFLIEWLERLIPLPLLHGRFVCGECGKRWIE